MTTVHKCTVVIITPFLIYLQALIGVSLTNIKTHRCEIRVLMAVLHIVIYIPFNVSGHVGVTSL